LKGEEHQTYPFKNEENVMKQSIQMESTSAPPVKNAEIDHQRVISRLFLGEIGPQDPNNGLKNIGVSHADCLQTIENSFALQQGSNGEVTVMNKAGGSGYVSLSVGCKPMVIVDPNGNMAVGSVAPKAKLHVDGMISSDDFYLIQGVENLCILRGGFSLKSLEPKNVTGYTVSILEDSAFEVRFAESFSKRPLVIAVLHLPQTSPTLIRIDYVDSTKFSFHDNSEKYEVCILI
jgi:hypothetical protein